MSTASTRLRRKIDLILPAYWAPGQMLLESPRAHRLYPAYLAAGSYVTLEMVPLMEAALDQARLLERTDAVAAGLVGYLERHIQEEMHGDEPGDDLIEDLEALDVDRESLRTAPPPEKIAALIGTQHFRVRHVHPVTILGFLWPEVYPPDPSFVERLIERTQLPRDGFRQLLLHSEIDVRHGRELQDFLDTLPLEPRHEQMIGLSALQTFAYLIDAWFEVLATENAAALEMTASGRPRA
jgi:hypothetical protein